jgi:hypothetical protein
VAEPYAGRTIVNASWASDALFAVTAIPAAAGVSALRGAALGVALTLFAAGIIVWMWAFAVALARNAQGDDIVVSSLFLAQGPVPRTVRNQLFAALAVSVALAAATGTTDAFGILAPMLPLGLVGLWGARHGEFPPRRERR